MILVTGGSGYVGSHVAKKLLMEGKHVRVLVRSIQKFNQEARLKGYDIDLVEGDVTLPSTLAPVFSDVDAVVHTVAIAIEKKGITYEDVNVNGTINVVEAAKSAGIQRFINISQLGADSRLPYRFLASKGKAQEYVADSGLDWTAFRPSVIWGPEDEFANTFAKLILITPIIFPIVDKKAKFQPVWVDDVATAILKSLDDPSTFGKEYELGGPDIFTIEGIERETLKALGSKRLLIPFPKSMLHQVVSLMEKFLPSPPVTRSLLELLAFDNVPKENTITRFVTEPLPFKSENTAAYMKEFRTLKILSQLFDK
jgi:uncharacterized protein YbjT (DUF2867 family)